MIAFRPTMWSGEGVSPWGQAWVILLAVVRCALPLWWGLVALPFPSSTPGVAVQGVVLSGGG